MRGVSIIIPAFNEARTIAEIIHKAKAENISRLGLEKEIIVVDDASTDNTLEIAKKSGGSGVKIIRHERNRGKGASLRAGFASATQDIILIQDADLEYDPADYERLLAPIVQGKADVVYGSRFVGDAPHRVLLFWHYLGNKIITFLTDMVANLNLTDIETGYKAFKREAINSIELTENRFGFEPEVTIKLAKRGWRFYEVGISYHARDYAAGKKITWRDGLWALVVIFKNGGWASVIIAIIALWIIFRII